MAALSASSVFAADVEVKASADVPKVEAQVKGDADSKANYKQEVRIESSVRPINKAGSLIGMEVRNRENERLGEIKDLVIDLQSGKVAYATLAVGGFLGLGEKLIAIPISALTPSEKADNYLLMNATRGEIVDAPSIAQTNWPDYRSPNYNDRPFFNPKGQGSAAENESGKAKLYTDANSKDRDVKVEANTDRNNRSRTVIGRVKSVNSDSVIIENAGRTETYSIQNKSVRASEFKSGDRVTVKYHTDANGKMVIDDLTRQ